MKNHSLLRRLLSNSILAGAAMATIAPAMAQDDDDADGDIVIVTGSRIPRADLQASSPIAVVSQDNFRLSGSVNVEDVLNELPQVAPSLTGTTNNGGTGIVTVDLRALGANRTLVLVNGRRYVASDASQQVDLNNIPSSLIDRVEVVTGGASSIYGSDAVAGAVNFILNDQFEGIEVGGQYNITEQGDGATYNVNLTMGGNFADGRGNAVIFADYINRAAVLAGAREFSEFALDDIGPPNGFIQLGSSRIPGGQILQNNLVFPGGATGNNAGFQEDGTPFAAPGSFNFQPDNFLQTPQERFLTTALARYDVAENIEAFAELTYANNRVAQQLAFDANDIPDVGPILVPLSNPLITNPALRQFLTDNFDQGTLGDATANDGIATIQDFRRRMVEVGPRFTDREFDALRGLFGLRGDLPFYNGTWSYEAYASWARTNTTEQLSGFTSDVRILQAIDATTDVNGEPVCNNNTGGCVPINLFGLGALSGDGLGFISPTAIVRRETEQSILNGVVKGDLFELPAGAVSTVLGVEYRDEQAANFPDQFIQSGELGPGQDESIVDGSFNVFEVFGETLIPVLVDAPFAKRLEIEGAFRVADYSTVGTNVTFKGGGSWTPFEGFKIRGLYQRAVRAPNLQELQQIVAGAESATDLCDMNQLAATATEFGRTQAEVITFCQAQGVPDPLTYDADSQINTRVTGNANLEEERANTYTVGFVWTPETFGNFSLSADYYSIDLTNAIDDLDADIVLEQCFLAFDINDPSCQGINRNIASGAISLLETTRANLAAETREGVDWQLAYSFDTDLFVPASVTFNHYGNYTIANEFQTGPDSPITDCNGIFGGSCTGLGNFSQPKWRLTNNLTYAVGPLSARLQGRIVGRTVNAFAATIDDLAAPDSSVQAYFDLAFNYDLNENVEFTAGVENLFDNDPPIQGFGFTGRGGGVDSNTDPSLYDVLGRRFFFGARFRF